MKLVSSSGAHAREHVRPGDHVEASETPEGGLALVVRSSADGRLWRIELSPEERDDVEEWVFPIRKTPLPRGPLRD